jgi:predicted nucleic acid-binding protein
MLVDTDVIIWHLRGFHKATQRLDGLPQLNVSAITWLELLQGFRNQAELLAVQKSLIKRNAQHLPLTPAITATAIHLMEILALSHCLRLADALIAATAIEHHLPLLTGNYKHFAVIEKLTVERFEI